MSVITGLFFLDSSLKQVLVFMCAVLHENQSLYFLYHEVSFSVYHHFQQRSISKTDSLFRRKMNAIPPTLMDQLRWEYFKLNSSFLKQFLLDTRNTQNLVVTVLIYGTISLQITISFMKYTLVNVFVLSLCSSLFYSSFYRSRILCYILNKFYINLGLFILLVKKINCSQQSVLQKLVLGLIL